MKPFHSFAMLAAIAAVSQALAVEATTTPVGYVTTNAAGNVANSSAGAYTQLAPPVLAASAFAGASTVTPTGGSVITFSGGVPTSLDGTYVLEISSATGEGWWSAVTSSTSTTITTADAFPAGLPANVSVTVRKFNTIDSVFGSAGIPGFTAFDGVAKNDQIQILDPVTQQVEAFIYLPAGEENAAGWVDFTFFEPAGSRVIYPGTSVRIVRQAAAPLPITMAGEVKTTKTQVDIYPRDNWVGQTLATGGTFGSQTLKDKLVEFVDGIVPNDSVIVIQPDQQALAYVALGESEDYPDGAIVDFTFFGDASTVAVDSAAGYIVRRNPALSASTVTFDAQYVAP